MIVPRRYGLRRTDLVRELADLERRHCLVREQLDLVQQRDRFAAAVLAGFASNANPDAGVTTVEVLRAYALADSALGIEDGCELLANPCTSTSGGTLDD